MLTVNWKFDLPISRQQSLDTFNYDFLVKPNYTEFLKIGG